MKFKRAGSAALAAAIFASTVCVCAEAAPDADMQTALTYVKQRMTFEDEYSEFSHSSYTEYNQKGYRFTWQTPDGNKGWNVSINGKVITNVNSWDYSKEYFYYYDSIEREITLADGTVIENPLKPHFAKKSETELLDTAKKWIKAINPTIYTQLEIDDSNFKVLAKSNYATLTFKRVCNGIPVSSQTGSISIDKDTGELMNYRINWVNGATFAPLENMVSKSTAMEGYRNEFPAKLVYTAEYDYETKTYIPHLIYHQEGNGEIDAFTGKLSTYNDYDYYGYDYAENAVASMAFDEDDDANPATGGEAIKFTDNELKKLEEEDKLVKAVDSMKQLEKEGIFFIPKNWDITNDNCGFNDYWGCYTRYISFTSKIEEYIDTNGDPIVPLDDTQLAAGTKKKVYTYNGNYSINAETGRVLSFYCNDSYSYLKENSLNIAQTTKLANSNIKKLLGKDSGKFKLDKDPTISKVYKSYDEEGKPIGDPIITSIRYNAPRTVNGIISESESLSFTINRNSKITKYNLNFHDIEYPSAEGIISADEAYRSFFNDIDFDLAYHCAYRTKDKKIVTALVYRTDALMYVDAFTGKRTEYNGREMTVSQKKPNSYSDLADSKYAKYAEKLLTYGICIADDDGKLSENDVIDAKTFMDLIRNTMYYGSLPEDVKETDKVSNKLAAKLIVRTLYGDKVASIKGIFKSPFKDVSNSSSYVGYIAIANAKGIMKGSKGNFQPNRALTRGKAIKLAYDFLS